MDTIAAVTYDITKCSLLTSADNVSDMRGMTAMLPTLTAPLTVLPIAAGQEFGARKQEQFLTKLLSPPQPASASSDAPDCTTGSESSCDPSPTTATSIPLWVHDGGKIKFLRQNDWRGVGPVKKEGARQKKMVGVQVRDLPEDHPCCGQQGLFATQAFQRYDVLGEYTGRVVGCEQGGHYVAVLENKAYEASLGVDAECAGNELRAINAYQGIASRANVKMRTVYIDQLPHIIVLCIEDVAEGEEFFLDYGEEYTNMYLRPKEVKQVENVCWGKMPFGDSGEGSSSDDDDC